MESTIIIGLPDNTGVDTSGMTTREKYDFLNNMLELNMYDPPARNISKQLLESLYKDFESHNINNEQK